MSELYTPPTAQQVAEPPETRARVWAQARLSPGRFLHTRGVVETVTMLATRHNLGEAVPALRVAAWLHDGAKGLPAATLLALAGTLGCAIRPIERACPALLHGAVAVALARRELGIDDPAVSSAIQYHTTGHPEMSQADKAFYIADLIEPTRAYAWIDQARALASHDLDEALLFAVTYQLRRLLNRGIIVDPRSVELHNRLLLDGVRFVPRGQD
jgi:predicted HD superfamily hydrolase involved in NAD metabolism